MEMIKQVSAILLFGVVGKSMMEARSFEEELAFYGSYHQDPINQAIHFVFVPTIWWSICVFMAYVDIPGLKGATVPGTKHPLTFATIMYLVYASYYLQLDLYCGGIFSVVLGFLYLQASTSVSGSSCSLYIYIIVTHSKCFIGSKRKTCGKQISRYENVSNRFRSSRGCVVHADTPGACCVRKGQTCTSGLSRTILWRCTTVCIS